jgi:3-methyladenine DNA glycosylase AlkD
MAMAKAPSLVTAVRRALAAAADPTTAAGMAAYMKSAMPCRGVTAPRQRALYRELFAAHPLPTFEAWQGAVLTLWRDAAFREERYAAIELTGHRAHRVHQTLDALPMYEEMIVTGAWWDLVDPIAVHRVGPLLAKYPREMTRTLRKWSKDPDLWKRRTSILAQVARKADTDLPLLFACIEPNLGDRDFFIRKAIGWALRSYAWTDEKPVVAWVAAHEDRLSPLSKREALKNVGKPPRAKKR